MARFMPGLRMPVFLSAGLYNVTPLKFFALDGFAAIISVPVWIWVGYFFGNNFDVLAKKMRQFEIGVYALLAVFVILLVCHYYFRKKAEKQEAA